VTEDVTAYYILALHKLLSPLSPVLQIRVFNTLGCILFLVAGTMALVEWRDIKCDMKCKQEDVNKQKAAVFLPATGVLCLVNSVFYLLDVAISVHSTLSSA
jgi:hypothetical protein